MKRFLNKGKLKAEWERRRVPTAKVKRPDRSICAVRKKL